EIELLSVSLYRNTQIVEFIAVLLVQQPQVIKVWPQFFILATVHQGRMSIGKLEPQAFVSLAQDDAQIVHVPLDIAGQRQLGRTRTQAANQTAIRIESVIR